ncbi:hypothetical protein RI367_005118 [Sorochytrium milnesiophthora]
MYQQERQQLREDHDIRLLRQGLTQLKRDGLYGRFEKAMGSRAIKEIGKLLDGQPSSVSQRHVLEVMSSLTSTSTAGSASRSTVSTASPAATAPLPVPLSDYALGAEDEAICASHVLSQISSNHRPSPVCTDHSLSSPSASSASSASCPTTSRSSNSPASSTATATTASSSSSSSTTTLATSATAATLATASAAAHCQPLFTKDRYVDHDWVASMTRDFRPAGSSKMTRQELRWDNDLYTPYWVSGVGKSKQGLCRLCLSESWHKIKISAYWYHLNFHHGISSTTGRPFKNPLQERYNWHTRLREGLCHKCKSWVPLDSARQTLVKNMHLIKYLGHSKRTE